MPPLSSDPYRFEDTGEGAWTVYSNEPTRTAAGGVVSPGTRIVTVFIGKTAEEVAEEVCDALNQEAARDRQREQIADDATTSKTIKARDLRENHCVKAPGAPAWSTIRRVIVLVDTPVNRIEVRLDWGALIYSADEDVEIEAVNLR